MKRIIFLMAMLVISTCVFAQYADDVVYLEKIGNGGTRIFSVTLNRGKEKDKVKLASAANRGVIKALLFDGVENYNDGSPLVPDPYDTFALSIIDENKKAFNTYCKATEMEYTDPKDRTYVHYIVEVNHYNLLRLLKMRGSLKSDFKE